MRSAHDIADTLVNGGKPVTESEVLDLCHMALVGEELEQKLTAIVEALADNGLTAVDITTDEDRQARMMLIPLADWDS